MKKILYILTCICIAFSTTATAQNAEQARKILDKTSATIMQRGGASANFTISGKSVGSVSGTVTIKGNKFYASTPAVKVWNNGKTQWTYTRSTNEVTISRPNNAQQMTANPYAFVSIYKSGYSLSMRNVGGQYEIHLKAIHPGRSIPEAYINISKSYYPTQIRMRQGSSWTKINVTNFHSRNISNSVFEFNKKACPGAEIVDLR